MLTNEQKEARKTGIGGSDAAKICGLSKYGTALDVYLNKKNLASDNKEQSRHAKWGDILEPVILAQYQEQTGNLVTKVPELLRHADYPWMIGNIDGFVEDLNIIVEAKTCDSRRYSEWGDEGSDEIPKDYLVQCAHYAIIKNARRVDLAVLIGGNDFRIYHYYRDKETEDYLIEIEADFWNNYYLKNIPPPRVNYKDVSNLWKKATNTSKTLPSDLNDHLKSYQFLSSKIKEFTESQEHDKKMICDYLEDSSILLSPLGFEMATWKEQKRNSLNVELLKKEMPEIYEKYLTTTTNRVFRTKEIKKHD